MDTFRDLLNKDDCIILPGVYDCISAMLAERGGFKALAVSGYAVEAALLGRPDLGFTNLTDVLLVAARIAGSVSLPVICDADTGYGGVNNVWHTVQCLEQAGVQGLHIEDQTMPKKCGGLSGRTVIPTEEMAGKVKAATDARKDSRLVIIARTDARQSGGVDEVICRLNYYLEAGADVAMVGEAYTGQELQRLGAGVKGPLAIVAGVPGWPNSFEKRETYRDWGINVVLYPFLALYSAAKTIHDLYQGVRDTGHLSKELADQFMVGFSWFNDFIGVEEWFLREAGYRKEES